MKSSQEAIQLLRQQIEEIELLEDSTVFSSEHTKWLTDTLYLLEEIFGKNSRIYTAFATMSWKPSGTYVASPSNINAEVDRLKMQAYKAGLDTARGLLESGIEQISRKGVEAVYEGKNTVEESSEFVKIISLLENKLRKIVRNAPSKEKEIQDAVETLFIGANLDGEFTRDKENLVYSSKTYVPDFAFWTLF